MDFSPRLCRSALTATLCASLAAGPVPAAAQAKGPTIIRDAEIEQLMRDYLEPIAKAAGLRTGSVKVVLIGERPFNAFVADGKHIFMNTGALIELQDPERDHRRPRARERPHCGQDISYGCASS